jgi:hypothetical protein
MGGIDRRPLPGGAAGLNRRKARRRMFFIFLHFFLAFLTLILYGTTEFISCDQGMYRQI